jgi:hypothetical protein
MAIPSTATTRDTNPLRSDSPNMDFALPKSINGGVGQTTSTTNLYVEYLGYQLLKLYKKSPVGWTRNHFVAPSAKERSITVSVRMPIPLYAMTSR